jgi:hypothetical protein
MSEEEDRAGGTGAVEANYQVALTGDGAKHVDVALWKSGGAKAGGHSFGGAGVVAAGIGRIDLDELLEDLAGEFLAGRLGAEREDGESGGEEAHTVIMPLGRTLIVLGLVLVAAGVVVTLAGRSPIPFGRLPGDIRIQGKNSSFYFPLTTCLIVSAVASLAMWLLRR